jgi:hypothetical protein
MPVVALLVAPFLVCFVSGFVAAASTTETATPEPWPDNVIPFRRGRRAREGVTAPAA